MASIKIATLFLSFLFGWLANIASLRPKCFVLRCLPLITVILLDLQLSVLPHFKGSDIILGLPALKKLEVAIHPNLNYFMTGDYTVQCNHESRKISCLIVDTDKMKQIIVKQARNKKDPVDVFLISLHFAEELATVKSDFGE